MLRLYIVVFLYFIVQDIFFAVVKGVILIILEIMIAKSSLMTKLFFQPFKRKTIEAEIFLSFNSHNIYRKQEPLVSRIMHSHYLSKLII